VFWLLVIVACAVIAAVGLAVPGLRLWRSVRGLMSELTGLGDDLERTAERIGTAERQN
jgi:hypothetical protein